MLEVRPYTLDGTLPEALAISDLFRRQSSGDTGHDRALSVIELETGVSQMPTLLRPREQFISCLDADHTEILSVGAKANRQHLRVHLIPQDVAVHLFPTQRQFQVMIDRLTENADLTAQVQLAQRLRQLDHTHPSHIAGHKHDIRLESLHRLNSGRRIADVCDHCDLLLVTQYRVQSRRSDMSRTDHQDPISYRKICFSLRSDASSAPLGACLRVHGPLPFPTAFVTPPE